MPGTGDIWSTARDLARFLTALHGGGLLPEAVQPVLYDINVALGPTGRNFGAHCDQSIRPGLNHEHAQQGNHDGGPGEDNGPPRRVKRLGDRPRDWGPGH